jgi:hypothetical protein
VTGRAFSVDEEAEIGARIGDLTFDWMRTLTTHPDPMQV